MYFFVTVIFILLPPLAMFYRSWRHRHKPTWRHFTEHGEIARWLHHLAVLLNLGIIVETCRTFNLLRHDFDRRHRRGEHEELCGCSCDREAGCKRECGCVLPRVPGHPCGRECAIKASQLRCNLRRLQIEANQALWCLQP